MSSWRELNTLQQRGASDASRTLFNQHYMSKTPLTFGLVNQILNGGAIVEAKENSQLEKEVVGFANELISRMGPDIFHKSMLQIIIPVYSYLTDEDKDLLQKNIFEPKFCAAALCGILDSLKQSSELRAIVHNKAFEHFEQLLKNVTNKVHRNFIMRSIVGAYTYMSELRGGGPQFGYVFLLIAMFHISTFVNSVKSDPLK